MEHLGKIREKHTVWSDLIFVEMKWSGTSWNIYGPRLIFMQVKYHGNTKKEKHIGENMEP